MNKPMDILYDEFVDSIAPEAILSKLLEQYTIEMNQAKQMQDKRMYA